MTQQLSQRVLESAIFERLQGYSTFFTVELGAMWVVVKIMVPFWVLIIIRHLIFRVPKKGP